MLELAISIIFSIASILSAEYPFARGLCLGLAIGYLLIHFAISWRDDVITVYEEFCDEIMQHLKRNLRDS